MKSAIVIILFLIPMFSHPQGCGNLEIEKNEFTGAALKTIWTPFAKTSGEGCNIIFTKVNTSYYIQLVYSVLGASSIGNGSGDLLMLKMGDYSIIKLEPTAVLDRKSVV